MGSSFGSISNAFGDTFSLSEMFGNKSHPIILSRRYWNCFRTSGFVKISPSCCVVLICSIVIDLSTILDLKWCSRTDRCFVLALVLWLVAISIQDLLSSKVLHTILGVAEHIWNWCRRNSSIKCIIFITSRSAVESAIYSASVVDNAMSGCMELFQAIGHPAWD